MAEIRAPNWPAIRPPATPAQSEARAAAQRAFFQAALAGKTEAATPGAPIAVAAPTRSADLHIQVPPAAPDKILRPGSIIDIKI